MVAIVARDAVNKPDHPEQREWLVFWIAKNGDVIFADSLSDIVAEIIPGYDDLDDTGDEDPHLEARIDVLAPLASQWQALILADMAERDIRLSEEELTAALRDKEFPAGIARWNPSDPLVLLATSYEPFTEAPRPEGAILWLDPSNEATFLSALNKLNEGELWVTGN